MLKNPNPDPDPDPDPNPNPNPNPNQVCMLKKAPRAMQYRGMEGLCLPKYPILATDESRAST